MNMGKLLIAAGVAFIAFVAVANSKTMSRGASLAREGATLQKTVAYEMTDLDDNSFIQCAAITRKGTRCKRRATYGAYCWQHAR